jgi:dehydrogenase/reductase SDR family protein 7B
MEYFRNKTILITGASSGIGKALATELSKEKPVLVLTARREDELEKVAGICRANGADTRIFPLDVTSENGREGLESWLKDNLLRIDFLINNAGTSQRDYGFSTSEEVDRRLMELNFFAPVILTKRLHRLFNPGAHVLVVSSMVGLMGFPLRTAYSASKHALNGFFESWQLEKTGFHFTIACPGRIQSNISYNALKGDGSAHNILDPGQAKGMDASSCAVKIIRAVKKKKKMVVVGRTEVLLYYIKKYIPSLFYRIASNIKST